MDRIDAGIHFVAAIGEPSLIGFKMAGFDLIVFSERPSRRVSIADRA